MKSNQRICSYGFSKLDQATGGLHAGELILIGARPGIGKSSFISNMASHMSDKDNCIPTIIENDENVIRSAFETKRNISSIKKKIKRGIAERKPLIIDELSLMRYSEENQKGTAINYGDFFSNLKKSAEESGIPVVVVANWPRNCEYRYEDALDPRPMLADLSSTALTEAEFDTILFLHRDNYYDEGGILTKDGFVSHMEVIVAKSRLSTAMTCDLDFNMWTRVITESKR